MDHLLMIFILLPLGFVILFQSGMVIVTFISLIKAYCSYKASIKIK